MQKINWADEIRSSVTKLIHKELKDLNNSDINKNTLIHESRKRVKNLRAILKLIKHDNGSNKFKLINNQLKNLNTKSAAARKAFVLLNICENLANTNSNNIYNELLKSFKIHMQDVIESSNPKYNINQLLSSYHDIFIKLDKQAADWHFDRKDFSVVKNGLAAIYDKGRKFYKISIHQGEVIIFHELRKSAKDLFYSLEVIQKCWKPVIKAYNNQIKILTDHIGDIHDLYELKLELNNKTWSSYKTAKENLIVVIDNQINSKKKYILCLAEKIYSEKTSNFIGRFSKLANTALE